MKSRLCLLILTSVGTCLLSSAAWAVDWFVLPEGAGRKDGENWENAASGGAGGLQGLVDRLQAGDRLLVGSGEYRDAKMVVQTSGSAQSDSQGGAWRSWSGA